MYSHTPHTPHTHPSRVTRSELDEVYTPVLPFFHQPTLVAMETQCHLLDFNVSPASTRQCLLLWSGHRLVLRFLYHEHPQGQLRALVSASGLRISVLSALHATGQLAVCVLGCRGLLAGQAWKRTEDCGVGAPLSSHLPVAFLSSAFLAAIAGPAAPSFMREPALSSSIGAAPICQEIPARFL